MLRKALTLGMVFILALSLLAVSMITCFTYDAEAHKHHHHWCVNDDDGEIKNVPEALGNGWSCYWYSH